MTAFMIRQSLAMSPANEFGQPANENLFTMVVLLIQQYIGHAAGE
jgi:hypothetical protein